MERRSERNEKTREINNSEQRTASKEYNAKGIFLRISSNLVILYLSELLGPQGFNIPAERQWLQFATQKPKERIRSLFGSFFFVRIVTNNTDYGLQVTSY